MSLASVTLDAEYRVYSSKGYWVGIHHHTIKPWFPVELGIATENIPLLHPVFQGTIQQVEAAIRSEL